MKIAVSGATGRMGKLIIEAVLCSNDLELVAAVTAPGVPEIGTNAGAAIGKTTGILISDDVQDLAKADVLIDFTRPQATLAYLPFCVAHNIGVVIGTTGFDAQSKEKIVEAARSVPVVFAPNMSVGVNSVLKLLEIAGALLSQYDCEIVEMHHNTKWMRLPARLLKWGDVWHRDAALISIRLQFSVEKDIPVNVPMEPSALLPCAAGTLSVTIP